MYDYLILRPNPHNKHITQVIRLDESYYAPIFRDIIYALEIYNTKQMTGLAPWDLLDSKKDLKLRDVHIIAKMEALKQDADELRMKTRQAQQSSKKPTNTVKKFR